MIPTRENTEPPQTVQEGVFCDDTEGYGYTEDSGSTTACQRPKPRAPTRDLTSNEKEKQPERRRNAGKLSRLPDMPLDILYEVCHRTDSIALDDD